MLTPEQLEEIRKRADAATPGPWMKGYWSGQCFESHFHSRDVCNYQYTLHSDSCGVALSMPNHELISSDSITSANSDFIAHARQDIPALLDHIERLTKELREYEEDRSCSEHGPDCPYFETAAALRAENASLETEKMELATHLGMVREGGVMHYKTLLEERDSLAEKLEAVTMELAETRKQRDYEAEARARVNREMDALADKLKVATEALFEIGHGPGPQNWSGSIAREALARIQDDESHNEQKAKND